MVEIACRTERRNGVTLVEAVVENTGEVTRRVRLEHVLDGPAWPPRRRGAPVDDWNAGAVSRTLAPGERAGVGFASPAPPESPPMRVADSERVDVGDGNASGDGYEATDADDVVRRLGDPSPPRDAVPSPGDRGTEAEGSDDATSDAADEAVPPAVADWFAAVEERVETAESCAAAATLSEATRAVEDAGDLAAVASAVDRLPADAAALRAAGRRAESLADRAEAVDGEVPVTALRTLA